METIRTFLKPVIDLQIGNGGKAVKTVRWTVFSESPNSYAVRWCPNTTPKLSFA